MRWLLVVLVAGCTLPNMPVATTLAPQQPLSRSIMSRGDLRFGDFHVTGWTTENASETWRGEVLPEMLRHGEGYEDYGFSLEESGQPPRMVRCSAAVHSDSLKAGRSTITSSSQSLRCAIWLAPGTPDYASLVIGDDGAGTLTQAGRSFAVEGRSIQGRRDTLEPAGYAVVGAGTDLMVVQRVNGAAIWIARDATGPDRGLYAAAAAALLTYQPLATP